MTTPAPRIPEGNGPGIARGKLGYLVPEFPNQTHAFFWREVQALRDAGTEVVLFSTRRPPDSACPHEFAAAARRETSYLFPPETGAAMRMLLARPGRVAQCVAYAAGLGESNAKERARVMALIVVAAGLCARCRATGVDHVHIHSCANAAHIGALAHILDGLSYSLTLHGHLPVYGTDHAAKFARARMVTTVTRALRADVLGVAPETPVQVVSMGVDTARFAVPDRATGNDALRFVSIARLNPVKGHVYFLQAMRRLIDEGHALRYRIAGDGPALPQIKAEIGRLNLAAHVTLIGPIGEDAVLQELCRADAFVLTSFGQGEAAPVAVMEAMATGLPVICSDIGGTPEMITDGVDGLMVPQRDVDAITNAARMLLSDPDLRQRIGIAARQKAEAAFDFRVKARELLAALGRAP